MKENYRIKLEIKTITKKNIHNFDYKNNTNITQHKINNQCKNFKYQLNKRKFYSY